MTNQKLQEETIAIIEKAKRVSPEYNYSWFARKLGQTPQALDYNLHLATKFDYEIYEQVKNICIDQRIISPPSEAWKKLNKGIREIEVSLFHNLELLNLATDQVGKDDEFNEDEKPEMIAALNLIQNGINDKIEKIKKEVGGW